MSLEQIAVTPEVAKDSPEYITEMAAKGAAAVNGGVEPPVPVEISTKPEGVPDKFYNPVTGEVDYASMTKSYVELEKSKSKQPVTPKEIPKVDTPVVTPEAAEAGKAVAEAGVDMNSLSAEYADAGELSQESYDKLAKAGIPQDMVDNYIEGQLAKVEVVKGQAHAITEGADGYKAMIEWATTNSKPDEIKAYNMAVNSANTNIRELAIKDMWSKYGKDTGNTGNLITGKENGKIGSGVYESRSQMMADMANPKYKEDPAFRKSVETKLANSNIF